MCVFQLESLKFAIFDFTIKKMFLVKNLKFALFDQSYEFKQAFKPKRMVGRVLFDK